MTAPSCGSLFVMCPHTEDFYCCWMYFASFWACFVKRSDHVIERPPTIRFRNTPPVAFACRPGLIPSYREPRAGKAFPEWTANRRRRPTRRDSVRRRFRPECASVRLDRGFRTVDFVHTVWKLGSWGCAGVPVKWLLRMDSFGK